MKNINIQIFDYMVSLELDDEITLVNGDSGLGKTLLFNYFDRQSYGNNNIRCFNALYVNRYKFGNKSVLKELKNELKSIKNTLIIIDNADVVLNDELRSLIAFDNNNSYLLFGRNVSGLWLTENNIATLVRDNKSKTMYLDYYFKDVNRKI